MSSDKHLDGLLREWSFDPQSLSVRLVKGDDGRDVIQVRVDLGILQLRPTVGRMGSVLPTPRRFSMLARSREERPRLRDGRRAMHGGGSRIRPILSPSRRMASASSFHRAVQDADHTLGLMDVCRDHSPDEEWTMSHEQYRPFVLFHRTRAAALAALDESESGLRKRLWPLMKAAVDARSVHRARSRRGFR